MLKQVFALVDCNNFFVSCERAFQPSLEHKPVMVLSSNDGCVISRSKEVKQLGIPMGMPFFKCKDIVKEHGIVVFSSNFSLYGDLSHRVMDTLNQFTDKIEIYSIDEAFLQLDYSSDNEEFCRTIKKIVRQWTRIPVSIGIAPTKVLAKVANHLAKKNDQYGGVVDITDKNIDDILYTVPINDIWGVGRQTTRFLTKNNISTALDLKNAPDTWIKEHLKITGLKIAYELRGISCLPLEELRDPKKGIMCTRSFGKAVTSLDQLVEAVATYTERAAEKLREEHRLATYLSVYIRTNYFNQDKKYSIGKGVELPVATSFTPDLVREALQILKSIYKEGFRYAKAGVFLTGLVPETSIQQNLFVRTDTFKQKKLMESVDALNQRFGKETLTYAGAGISKEWSVKKEFISKKFTTSLKDLPWVK